MSTETASRHPSADDERSGSEQPERNESGSGRDPHSAGGLVATVKSLVQRVMRLKPVRVFQHYGANGGPLLASGLSYRAIFAVFAALWVGFSVAGFVIKANPPLKDALFNTISHAIPGLIGPDGAVDPEALLNAPVLGWTGAIALVGMLMTMIGWFEAAREAIRRMFHLDRDDTSFLLLKLKDLGIVVGFSLALIVSAALSVGSTTALGALFDAVGIHGENLATFAAVRAAGLIIVFAFDAAVLTVFYRILAGVPIPLRRLIAGAVLGAIGLGVLKALGSSLLGGASKNPLLASFAVIIGLLIWFNLICQVILLAASWIAVGMSDAGIDARNLSPRQADALARKRLADARVLVAVADRERIERDYEHASWLRRRMLARRLDHARRVEAEFRRRRRALDEEGDGG